MAEDIHLTVCEDWHSLTQRALLDTVSAAHSEMLAHAFYLLFVAASRLDTYGDISRHDYFV